MEGTLRSLPAPEGKATRGKRGREKEESRIPLWDKTQKGMSLARLWKELESKGGKTTDWDFGMSQGLTPHDLGWIDTVAGGVDAESFAEDLMVVGRLLHSGAPPVITLLLTWVNLSYNPC